MSEAEHLAAKDTAKQKLDDSGICQGPDWDADSAVFLMQAAAKPTQRTASGQNLDLPPEAQEHQHRLSPPLTARMRGSPSRLGVEEADEDPDEAHGFAPDPMLLTNGSYNVFKPVHEEHLTHQNEDKHLCGLDPVWEL